MKSATTKISSVNRPKVGVKVLIPLLHQIKGSSSYGSIASENFIQAYFGIYLNLDLQSHHNNYA